MEDDNSIQGIFLDNKSNMPINNSQEIDGIFLDQNNINNSTNSLNSMTRFSLDSDMTRLSNESADIDHSKIDIPESKK